MDKENESIQQENPSTEEVKESEPVTRHRNPIRPMTN